MKVEKDFEELFKLFNKHKVRYCIIGSYAVAYYARPRYTKDIDIFIGLGDLIKLKKASNRPQDRVDLLSLLETKKSIEGNR